MSGNRARARLEILIGQLWFSAETAVLGEGQPSPQRVIATSAEKAGGGHVAKELFCGVCSLFPSGGYFLLVLPDFKDVIPLTSQTVPFLSSLRMQTWSTHQGVFLSF